MDGVMEALGNLKQVESGQNQVSTPSSTPPRIPFEWIGIPSKFKNKALDSFRTEEKPDPRKVAMEALRSDRGLFITGKTGTGKTHLAVAALSYFAPERPFKNRFGNWMPMDYKFVPSVEFFLELKQSFSLPDGESEVLKKYGSTQLLILDDVGAEKVTDWSRQMFYTLIDRRYRNEKQTIVTSNLSLEQLSQAIDDRISSRIVEMCTVITLTGGDHRLG